MKKIYGYSPETPVREVLEDKLKKGLISQELYNSALKELETLEKASGEGSKGGKVIGHTKSGKPVYENKHSSYKNFTKKDHEDAVSLHNKELDRRFKSPEWYESKTKHHEKMLRFHDEKSKMKD